MKTVQMVPALLALKLDTKSVRQPGEQDCQRNQAAPATRQHQHPAWSVHQFCDLAGHIRNRHQAGMMHRIRAAIHDRLEPRRDL